MMQLGAEGVFVGSGIFKSGDPAKRAAAIVKAVANFTDAKLIAALSEDWARPWWASTPTKLRSSWRSAGASPAERIAHERLRRPDGRRAGGPRCFCRARSEAVPLGAHCIELRQAADLKQDFDRLVLPAASLPFKGSCLMSWACSRASCPYR